MSKYSLLSCVLFLFVTRSVGQVNIQSPEVASLSKYIDFPVDKGTGTVDVNIPIYAVKCGGIDFPISLSYHTGGIKVTEIASNVGLGWALRAGGVISRSVKGKPDEGGYYSNQGFDISTANISWNGWAITDSEPDIFSFSINGHRGKFFFDTVNQVHFVTEQDISVSVTTVGATVFGRFILKTADGVEYHFDGVYEYFTYNDILSPPSYDPSSVPSAWHLTKILTSTKDSIVFEYQEDSYTTRGNSADAVPTPAATGACAACYSRPRTEYITAQTVTKITSATSEISFIYKSNLREDILPGTGTSKALEYVEIKDRFTNNLIRKYKLTTSYFQSNDNTAIGPNVASNSVTSYTVDAYLQKRLRLDEVQEFSATGLSNPAYKFYYNKNNTVTQTPNRLSNAQDHWGYYNGVSSNKCLISYYSMRPGCSNSVNLADRGIRQEYNKAFVLDEVVNPMGGVTQYLYDNPSNSNLIPGVRIKNIINGVTESAIKTTRSFLYGNIYLTGGGPVYAQMYTAFDFTVAPHANFPRTGTRSVIDSYCWSENGYYVSEMDYYLAFPYPINYSGDLAGNYAYYDKVTEYIEGNGSIESFYSFQEIEDYINDVDIYPLIFSKPALNAGKLINEVVKNSDGIVLKETTYTYEYYYKLVVATESAARHTVRPCGESLTFYPLYTGFSFLKEKEETTYLKSHAGSVLLPYTTKTVFDYEGIPLQYRNYAWAANPTVNYGTPVHRLITKEVTTQSDGSNMTRTYKYPHDFSSTAPYNSMITNKHLLSPIIEESRFNGTTHLETKRNNFQDLGSGLYLKTSEDYKKDAGSYTPLLNFESYDGTANLLGTSRVNDFKISYVWGYNKSLTIIKGENITSADLNTKVGQVLSDLGYSNGLADLDVWLLSLSNVSTSPQKAALKDFGVRLRTKLGSAKALITLYTYAPLIGMTSLTDTNNRTTYYEYDSFGRIIAWRDDNGNLIKTIKYNYKQ